MKNVYGRIVVAERYMYRAMAEKCYIFDFSRVSPASVTSGRSSRLHTLNRLRRFEIFHRQVDTLSRFRARLEVALGHLWRSSGYDFRTVGRRFPMHSF